MPARNEADLEKLPEEVRKEMQFVFAQTVEDVLNAALEPKSEPDTIQIEPEKNRRKEAYA